MGKYRRYKNIIEMFLSSEKGKRALNFCYGWGASIVIIGALFKLLHLPYANQILFISMITEACVFFISAFERPNDDYHWEDVFPVLKSKNPLDRPDFSKGEESTPTEGMNNGSSLAGMGKVQPNPGASAAASLGMNVTEEDTKNLSESIKKLSGAAEQISKMAELTEATQHYLEQLSAMTEKMAKFSEVTGSLTEVSDTLLNSYKGITDNSGNVTQSATSYVEQMDSLNRNIAGLNSIYETQLKSISTQMENVERINAGLNRIREMYEGSVIDSSVFRNETEKMAQQLSQLNQVYGRLLQAMTVNMFTSQQSAGNNYQAQQNPYAQQPPYQPPYGYQQPPYNTPRQG